VEGGEAASIEYAISVLGVTDVVVCGHTRCGGVGGILDPGSVAHLPAVSKWLDRAELTRRIVSEAYRHLDGAELHNAAVQEHVLVQLENLRSHPCVGVRLRRGDLRLHGWVFKLESGKTFAYDSKEGQFLPLVELAAITLPETVRIALDRGV
jgi:carbonic anhydrase